MDEPLEVRCSAGERERAVQALSEHVQAQRLSIDEFDSRAATANGARSRADLLELFTDLPRPHPAFDDGEPGAVAVHGQPAAATEYLPETQRGADVTSTRKPGGVLRTAAYGLFPAAGVIAVVLMVLTGSWFWFLLIPPVAYAARELAKKGQHRPG